MSNRIIYKRGDVVGECMYLSEEPTFIGKDGKLRRTAKFMCRCGNEFVSKISRVKCKVTRSCGCIKKNHFVHGGKNDAEYNIWCKMRQRCNNPSDASYKNYGGRGITFCKEWQSYENFLTDMGRRPSGSYTLERINVNGNYCKENCKWATWDEQRMNKRKTLYIEYNGERKTLKEWAIIIGKKYILLYNRIVIHKWPIEVAFNSGRVHGSQYVYKGVLLK